MNVSLQNIDKVSALLTVKLEKADYQEKVDKSLKSFRQKAQIPGFRKGMVPMSLVKKMYGKSALAEEVNKLLSETVYKYIQDNKVNILGEPLPNEDKQQEIDFDTMEEFEFLFDIALAPEFKAEVSAKDKVDYYTIEVTDESPKAMQPIHMARGKMQRHIIVERSIHRARAQPIGNRPQTQQQKRMGSGKPKQRRSSHEHADSCNHSRSNLSHEPVG